MVPSEATAIVAETLRRRTAQRKRYRQHVTENVAQCDLHNETVSLNLKVEERTLVLEVNRPGGVWRS